MFFNVPEQPTRRDIGQRERAACVSVEHCAPSYQFPNDRNDVSSFDPVRITDRDRPIRQFSACGNLYFAAVKRRPFATRRDVGFAEEWFEHTVSLRWDNGDFRIIAGITNLFDNDPPLIDTNEVFGISNTPIGNGYNLDGREFFGQLLYRF